MFFNKEVVCEQCDVTVNKKSICTVDYSRQGRIKQQPTLKLCQKCGLEKLIDDLRKYSHKAVIIQPSSKHNAYVFYSFEEYNDGSYNASEFVENIKSFLPPTNEKCNFCSHDAVYTCCPSDIYYESPYDMDINLAAKQECVFVCKECLIELFRSKIETEKINFNGVYPSIGADGFYTPWDV